MNIFKNIIFDIYEFFIIIKNRIKRVIRGFDGIPIIILPASWADENNMTYKPIRDWARQKVRDFYLGNIKGMVLPYIIDSNGNRLLDFVILNKKEGRISLKPTTEPIVFEELKKFMDSGLSFDEACCKILEQR